MCNKCHVCRQVVSGQVMWTSCDKVRVDKRATKTSAVPEVPEVPRLPPETKVDVTMSPSPTPATQDARRCRRPRRHLGTKRATRASPVPSVPRLPRKVTVDVTKSHACHAGCTSMSPSATPATQRAAASTAATGSQARHQSQPSARSATLAT